MMKKIIYFFVCFSLINPACNKAKTPANLLIEAAEANNLSLQTNTANQLEITEKSNTYTISTTGQDPYIFTKPLRSQNDNHFLVLTFDYTSSETVTTQYFLAPPTTEARSVNNVKLEASSSFRNFSVDLGEKITSFGWGAAGNQLRIDFGTKPGVHISIKNLRLRKRTDAEQKLVEEEKAALALENQRNEKFKNYLNQSFAAKITEVVVSNDVVKIQGNVPNAADGYLLAELLPGSAAFEINTLGAPQPIQSTNFEITLNRKNQSNGITYDRGLSRWAIIKTNPNGSTLESHAHYPDQIAATRFLPLEKLQGKKGLGGFSIDRGFTSDLDELDITSATINITLTGFMHLTDPGNAIAHDYQGKTYYFKRSAVENFDRSLKATADRNIIVAGIILLQGKAGAADPKVGELLEHPDHVPGDNVFFTMPRMDNLESIHCYAAALDFLASRYCQVGNPYGRIHHFIMHNEVDQGVVWTNMGANKPLYIFLDNYYHSMRLANNIIKGYDSNAEIFASFTHSWNESAVGGDYFGGWYSTLELAEGLLKYAALEGDFNWGMACHPYPEDLNEPKTWEDKRATFSMKSPLVTFKNLEVLNEWIWKPANMYKNTRKRSLWLSENGTNSRTYSEKDLSEQAAGFAYAWKKIKQLDGIDGIQWHNWIDNRAEFGLRIGLRRYPDDQDDPGGKKPVWHLYKAAGTNEEEVAFEPYKSVIGINNWSEIDKKPVTP